MHKTETDELLQFIQNSPSPFHTIASAKKQLDAAGFISMREEEHWELTRGGKYYVTRNDSSMIAFSIPQRNYEGYRIIASHSDSPCLKVKENPEITVADRYVKLNVEGYGGMICSSWFDRPLSVAGRVVVREGNRLVSHLVNVKRDLLMIPNLAIHMNREVNSGYKYNQQVDMLPLFGDMTAKDTFMEMMARAAKVQAEDILAHDLYVYNRQEGTVWGANGEFISSPRLDDLQCAYASLKGFLQAERQKHLAVCCVLDNEEVGSQTRQGAASTFLYDTLIRINESLGKSYEQYLRNVSESFLLSADNAHALHPNHQEVADPVNRPVMNGGIVLKYSANQKYCTDAVSAAMFKDLCQKTQVPYQVFTNRSDMAGGSTLGNISGTKVSMRAVDIGLAQLAMHSAYETAGVKDTEYLIRAAVNFFA